MLRLVAMATRAVGRADGWGSSSIDPPLAAALGDETTPVCVTCHEPESPSCTADVEGRCPRLRPAEGLIPNPVDRCNVH